MKKRLLPLICLSIFGLGVQAQTMVSTSPQNRNVILEEFTGIHCGYCPDGHKRANDLVAANQGKVFLVNIHAGSYANPGAGEPDFRTTAGSAIDGAAGVTGYPAGSVNRSKSPWAESRGAWAATASGILSQSSPVNVAVSSTIDFNTRELTTIVEVYYTADSKNSSNSLSIALLQDNMLGPQTDYGNYNPTNWVDGQYRHNHVLRQMITSGSFGEAISTTTKGSFYTKTFKTVLPASIAGQDLILYNLDVIAFVTEGTQNNILSGTGAPVTFDESIKTDLAMTDKTVKPNNFCFTSLNPKIDVKNNFDKTITSFDVTATVGGKSYKQSFSGSLAAGETTTMDWGSINYSAQGMYELKINGFTNVNGGNLIDMDYTNDAAAFSGFGFKQKAFTYIKGGFEGIVDQNFAIDNSVNRAVTVYNPTASVGAYSDAAVLFYLHSSWQVAGLPGDILVGEADFTNTTDPSLSYFYAYADGGQNGTQPKLKVFVSADCGATWDDVNELLVPITGAPADPQYLFAPTGDDYRKQTIALTSYAGKTVMIKIAGIPGTSGNALFVDEIEIGSAQKIAGVTELVNNVKLYPNPASSEVNISTGNASDVTVEVMDLNGKLIMVKELTNGNTAMDVSTLSQGVYMLNISYDNLKASEKLVITK